MDRISYYYLDYLYREVGLTAEDIESVPEFGSADEACAIIAEKEYIKKQFEDIPFGQLKEIVCNLCDNPHIQSRKDAIMYIVWMVALSIKEEGNGNEPELWVYVWNISHITRDAPDKVMVKACDDSDYEIPEEYDAREEGDDENYEVVRYTPDEFAEMVNDQYFDDVHHYIRFIKAE